MFMHIGSTKFDLRIIFLDGTDSENFCGFLVTLAVVPDRNASVNILFEVFMLRNTDS